MFFQSSEEDAFYPPRRWGGSLLLCLQEIASFAAFPP